MKYTLVLLLIFVFVSNGFSQDFFDTDFDKQKKYIVLTNPTVRNIQTIQYLTKAKLLDTKKRKMKFVGVYYHDQKYDFKKTKDYLEENKLDNFFLHEIEGDLNEENLFKKNTVSEQLRKVFDNSVGIFFFGGADIPPGVYNEENTLSVVTTPQRHYFEATFLFHLLGSSRNQDFVAFLQDKPEYLVTGFCLGMQTMNVATGGTLIQDIPSEVYGAENPEETVKLDRENLHRNYWQKIVEDSLFMGSNLHTIQYTVHPFFNTIINIRKQGEPRVYSSHHQAVEKLGKGMEVTAISPDGKIVEGLAHNKYPNVFAVQFHPEVPALYEDMGLRKFSPDDTPMSYHDLIGQKSVQFHEKYWGYISEILRKSKNKKK